MTRDHRCGAARRAAAVRRPHAGRRPRVRTSQTLVPATISEPARIARAEDRNLTVLHLKLLLRRRARAARAGGCDDRRQSWPAAARRSGRRSASDGHAARCSPVCSTARAKSPSSVPPIVPRPPKHRRAAQHHGGDRIELVAGAGVRSRLPQMRDVDDRRHARDQPRQHVDEADAPGHGNRRVARALRREPDRVQRPANHRTVQQHHIGRHDQRRTAAAARGSRRRGTPGPGTETSAGTRCS